VSDLKQYDIMLTTLPAGESEFSYELHRDFFEAMDNVDVLDADIAAHLHIDHKNDIYYFTVTLSGNLILRCDRCLEPMSHCADAIYKVTVKYGLEYDDSADGVVILPDTASRFNVAEMLYSTAILTIPMRCVHPAGDCDPVMEHILHDHGAATVDSDNDDSGEEVEP